MLGAPRRGVAQDVEGLYTPHRAVVDTLVEPDENLEMVPALAESWEVSDDGTVYTFHLREEARFHDGRLVSAEDIKYSWERACSPRTASPVAAVYLGDIVGAQAVLAGRAEEMEGLEVVDDRTLRVWQVDELLDPATEPEARVLKGHTAKVVDLAFSADGRWLASSSWDHSIGLWSVPAFDRKASLRAHEGPVNAARFANQGRTLYSAGGDGHVRQWDVEAAKYVRSPVENGWGINVLAIDETQDLLAYGTANGRMCSTSLNGDRSTTDYVAEGTPVLALTLVPETAAAVGAAGAVLDRDVVGKIDISLVSLKGS